MVTEQGAVPVHAPDHRRGCDRGHAGRPGVELRYARQGRPHAETMLEFHADARSAPAGSRSGRTALQISNSAMIAAAAHAASLASQQLGIAPQAVVFEFICGATSALDEYSGYLSGAQLDEVFSQIEGNFVGLGVELKALEGRLVILRVTPFHNVYLPAVLRNFR